MVASDRISAFDRVFAEPMPDKGRVLTAMTDVLVRASSRRSRRPTSSRSIRPTFPTGAEAIGDLAGRAMLVRRAEMLPIECIVRGYITGSAWKEYAEHRHDARHAAARRAARVRPAARAGLHAVDQGDRGPRREHLLRRRPPSSSAPSSPSGPARSASPPTAAARRSLEQRASSSPTPSSSSASIDGELAICDEILTPDSSRFWPADAWQPGARRPRSTSSRCATGRSRPAGTRTSRRRDPRRRSSPRPATRYIAAYEQISGRVVRRLVGRRVGGDGVKFCRRTSRSAGSTAIADPEGRTIERALPALGFARRRTVRVGKVIRFALEAADEARGAAPRSRRCAPGCSRTR